MSELKRYGMGLLLDIVPNHMAASVGNPWWADVLENGQSSPYASYFDIDWDSHPQSKIVLPILGAPLEEVLHRSELRVSLGRSRPSLRYHDTRLPLSHTTSAAARRASRDPARMAALLRRQPYELAFWRDGVQRLNYRRFFDISDLVGVRVEDPAVFAATHDRVLRLVREGKVTGLRIDHIDGLRDPLDYLQRLQAAVAQNDQPYVLVEKILLGNETLPEEWPAHGTTGYEFANLVNALFVDPQGLKRLGVTYQRFTGMQTSFTEVLYTRKNEVMRELFPGELRGLAVRLRKLAQDEHHEERSLAEALMELSACLPVYRTYTRGLSVSHRDHAYISDAVEEARRRNPTLSAEVLDFVRRVLLLDFPASLPAQERQRWLEFVVRWQQFSGPVTAKGLEDTALYHYSRLVSLNDVGGDPDGAHVSDAVDRFHRHNTETLRRWPDTLNATSTHDTKRSEDVRARIDVLSEMPLAWARHVNRWSRLNLRKKVPVNGGIAPSPNEEMLLYQTLVGAWPLKPEDVPEFRERLQAYMIKAAREAKVNTSWLDPNDAYESALASFVKDVLAASKRNRFLEDFVPFQERIAYYGALNSLAQTLLKITSPGVPDFYQGTELWNLRLVDPDNRRPVGFAQRARLLADVEEQSDAGIVRFLKELLTNWPDGRIKMYVIMKALSFRNSHAAVFRRGHYIPLHAKGERQAHIIAFARTRGSDWALVAVPHLVRTLCSPARPPIGRTSWKDTALLLPPQAPARWVNILTGESLATSRTAAGSVLECAPLFRRLPLALLSRVPR